MDVMVLAVLFWEDEEADMAAAGVCVGGEM